MSDDPREEQLYESSNFELNAAKNVINANRRTGRWKKFEIEVFKGTSGLGFTLASRDTALSCRTLLYLLLFYICNFSKSGRDSNDRKSHPSRQRCAVERSADRRQTSDHKWRQYFITQSSTSRQTTKSVSKWRSCTSRSLKAGQKAAEISRRNRGRRRSIYC